MLPHLAPDRLEDSSMVNSQGPDITFGMRDPAETTANTSGALEDSKDLHPRTSTVESTPEATSKLPADSPFQSGTTKALQASEE